MPNISANPYDINIRATYGSQAMGREGLSKFCGVLDLPPPVSMPAYSALTKKIAIEAVNNAERLIQLTLEDYPENIEILNDGSAIAHVAVSVDGTRQKRGHNSKNGVVFVISIMTGEVIDYEVKTMDCHMLYA